MELQTCNINLKVLRAGYFNGYEIPSGVKLTPRICHDYELEYYLKSDGGILCDGEMLSFHPGEINFRKPGQRVQGISSYSCYIICFHVTGQTAPADYIFGTPQQAQPCYRNPLLDSLPNRLKVKNTQYVARLFEQIHFYFLQHDDFGIFRTNQLLYELMGELFQQTIDKNKQADSVNPKVMKAAQTIKRSFSESIKINRMIAESGLSRAYFHKCFKQHTGLTPLELILSLRLEKAKELLCLTNSPIAEIAIACGYDDPVYFTYLFKRQLGLTPSQYRKSQSTLNNK